MSCRFVCKVVIVVSVLSLLLAGCQAAPPAGANPPSEALIEQMKAEARRTGTRHLRPDDQARLGYV